jgi:hypothetical protein
MPPVGQPCFKGVEERKRKTGIKTCVRVTLHEKFPDNNEIAFMKLCACYDHAQESAALWCLKMSSDLAAQRTRIIQRLSACAILRSSCLAWPELSSYNP